MSGRLRQVLAVGGQCGVPLAAVLGIAAYLAGALSQSAPGFPWDDAWIHATLARNLAETGRLGLQAGVWGAGSSSLLWVLLLAAGYRLGLSPWMTAVLLGGSAHAFASWAFSRLSGDLLGRTGGTLAGMLYALFGPLVFLALSGMEAAFFLSLGIAAVWTWTRRRPVWTGTLLGLLLLARVESVVLWGVLLVAEAAWSWRGRRWGALAWTALLPLVGLVAASAVRLASEGHLIPLTLSGRRWLWGLPPPGTWAPEQMALFVGNWRIYLLDWFLQAFRLEGWPALHAGYRFLLALWGLGGSAFLAGRTWQARGEPRAWGSLLLLLWGLGHTLLYLLLLPIASFRHQVPLLPAVLLVLSSGEALLFAGLRRALGPRRPWLPWAARGLAAAALLGWAGLTCAQWLTNYRDQVEHINRVHVRMGQWIAARVPKDAVVASFDIGAVSFFGEHEVVDLGGLTDEAILPALYGHQVAPYLQARGAAYLVMISRPGDYWWGQLGLVPPTLGQTLTLSELQSCEIAPYARSPFDRPADYYFYPASRLLVIYAIQWVTPAAGPAGPPVR